VHESGPCHLSLHSIIPDVLVICIIGMYTGNAVASCSPSKHAPLPAYWHHCVCSSSVEVEKLVAVLSILGCAKYTVEYMKFNMVFLNE
jgi:hypothetical protein